MTPLTLPRVPKAALNVEPLDWNGLTRRFMNDGELEVLVALARSVAPRAVLEFGVNEGRTAKALLDNVASIERYQGVDVEPGYVPAKAVQRREVPERPGWMAKADPRFDLILRRSGSLDLTIADLAPCDVAFIDGDHGWRGVLNDTLLSRALVRAGGLIIWHDYHALGTVDVRDVLETLAKFASGRAAIHHVEGTWLAFERR